MIVRCGDCSKVYDDLSCWTLCPHQPIEGSPEPFDPAMNPYGYCREHDLFACKNHEEDA